MMSRIEFLLTFASAAFPKTISIALELRRRGWTLLRAKRAIDELAALGMTHVELPAFAETDEFIACMAELGATARVIDPMAPVDVRALREELGMSRERFAACFGLDVGVVDDWENGERELEVGARSYFQVIAREPARVQAALVGW